MESPFPVGAVSAYLSRVYTLKSPYKLSNISSILYKYEGRERELVSKIERKYNVKFQGNDEQLSAPSVKVAGGGEDGKEGGSQATEGQELPQPFRLGLGLGSRKNSSGGVSDVRKARRNGTKARSMKVKK